jgi:hypothetical protein
VKGEGSSLGEPPLSGFRGSRGLVSALAAPMPIYVVERYVPGLSVGTTRTYQARLRRAAAELARDGTPVVYLGSTVVLGDESCFCRFDASSLEDVAAVNDRAGVPSARIVPALEFGTRRVSPGEKKE